MRRAAVNKHFRFEQILTLQTGLAQANVGDLADALGTKDFIISKIGIVLLRTINKIKCIVASKI